MSIVAFRPCLGVTVKDDKGKELTALAFEPTADTRRCLNDQRLVFRLRAAGFQVYAQYNPQVGNLRLAPITRRTSLVFSIRLKEADLLERFHPDLDATTGSNLYLVNLDDDGTVRASGTLSRGNTVEAADAARIVGRRPQPSGSPRTVLFVSDELAGRGAFGALELVLAPFPGPDPAAGRQYTVTFRRRS
ncbi:hypothetical protein PS862_01252 [Pseudomonas fluorescens]|uniref:Uncharacterized protein n=1 Tax=Pseudomonas fluorescens TaxID=294 RepID=A0A5E6Y7U6_PSEFL|nr:hypothetical protein [Pseudomonas fluorescens]VVN48639.1 hypothetical protein PS639_06077 [Pseudomonas fluorescens]VVO69250.1 hypothetical protein PS862_01252 [Pseudomonas fluorescens]